MAERSRLRLVLRDSRSCDVGGRVRIHPERGHMNGRHGVHYVAQCVACAALTLFFGNKLPISRSCDRSEGGRVTIQPFCKLPVRG